MGEGFCHIKLAVTSSPMAAHEFPTTECAVKVTEAEVVDRTSDPAWVHPRAAGEEVCDLCSPQPPWLTRGRKQPLWVSSELTHRELFSQHGCKLDHSRYFCRKVFLGGVLKSLALVVLRTQI